jgi:hypothetical protein
MGIPKKKNDKTSISVKASLKYRNAFLLRALIQSLTKYGSSLDTILAGLGAKYQQARLKHFFKELMDRLKRLERITNYGPDEPLYDTYKARCYHGWYNPGWVGTIGNRTSYQNWAGNVWGKLKEGQNLLDALNYAIQENDNFTPDSAINNYRLKGQGLLTNIYLSHIDY